jgi:hypothetical protein
VYFYEAASSLSFEFYSYNNVRISKPMRATFFTDAILLYLITLTMFGEYQRYGIPCNLCEM